MTTFMRMALRGFLAVLLALYPVLADAAFYAVTPSTGWSTIVTTAAGMAAGDTMSFGPGTYSVTAPIVPTNGTATAPVNFVGPPSAILQIATASVDVFKATTNPAYIDITGLTLDGNGLTLTNDAAIFIACPNNGTTTSGYFKIQGTTFQNILDQPAILVYQCDHWTLRKTTSYNVYQTLSAHNNDTTTTPHSGITVQDNVSWAPTRIAFEMEVLTGGTSPYNNINFIHNIVYGSNATGAGTCSAASLVDNSGVTTGILIADNEAYGTGNGGCIEIAENSAIVVGNKFFGTGQGFLIGLGNQTYYGNQFNDVTNANYFSQDGGYTATQWVGVNYANGSPVSGWSGHPNYSGITPPTCAPTTRLGILAVNPLTSPNWMVAPQVMQNLICGQSYESALMPNIYP